jgi:hypothetical protein
MNSDAQPRKSSLQNRGKEERCRITNLSVVARQEKRSKDNGSLQRPSRAIRRAV